MIDDENLPEKVRELLRSGRLPAHSPHRVWGGPGSGRERCLVCGEMVSPQEVAIEAEFNSANGLISLDFHGRCFRVLESEWRRFKPASDSTGNRATLRPEPTPDLVPAEVRMNALLRL
jgi:hypothetical protein